jgi:PAS domain S-box-containing protein
VTIPFGQAHHPADRVGRPREIASTAVSLDAYVVEASRWLSADEEDSPLIDDLDRPTPPTVAAVVAAQPRILVADDNADMRDYVRRLLAGRYEVNAVGDGESALAAAQSERPDLVITDVMMPRLDGFGLLKALRSDPESKTIPVIMLSARAGEDARIEGIQSGADDYLIKPFSARELVVRVAAAIELARVRREVAAANDRASKILENITDGFIAVDKDWRFTYMNAEAERMNRMSRNEALGKSHWEVFPQTVGTSIDREFHRAIAEQVAVEFENYYEPWNRWFEFKAYPSQDGGLSAYFRDVTARKQADERERQLAAETAVATAKFRAVFDQSGVFACIMTLDGIITEANRLCLEACGFRREEVLGRLFWECGWWSASEEVRAKIRAGTVLAS